jgi:hypothetical protein
MTPIQEDSFIGHVNYNKYVPQMRPMPWDFVWIYLQTGIFLPLVSFHAIPSSCSFMTLVKVSSFYHDMANEIQKPKPMPACS